MIGGSWSERADGEEQPATPEGLHGRRALTTRRCGGFREGLARRGASAEVPVGTVDQVPGPRGAGGLLLDGDIERGGRAADA